MARDVKRMVAREGIAAMNGQRTETGTEVWRYPMRPAQGGMRMRTFAQCRPRFSAASIRILNQAAISGQRASAMSLYLPTWKAALRSP